MKFQTTVVLLLLLLGLVVGQNCTGVVNGIEWDLSMLTYDPNSDTAPAGYSLPYTNGGSTDTFFVNFCAEVSSAAVSPDCNKGMESGSCQLHAGTYYGAGNAPDMEFQEYTPPGKAFFYVHYI